MLYIDYLAYNNAFRHVSINEKLLLGGGALVIAFTLSHPLTLITVAALMHLVMLYAGAPPAYLLRLWRGPAAFMTVGLLTLVASVSLQPFPQLWGGKAGPLYYGVTQEGLQMAMQVLLRSLAAVSCVFMIAVTTPITHLAGWLSRFRALGTILEIVLLTYRFIFTFLETAAKIYTAQQSRMGYSSYRRSLHSVALLAANIGRKTFLAARLIYLAMLSRNYTGRLALYCPVQQVSPARILLILTVLILIAATSKL